MPYLELRGIVKWFGQPNALRGVSLDVAEGEFVCFLGPSGCGKTTLLRIVAGLEQPDAGSVVQAQRDITRLPPAKREFGIVFQSYALFPNLTAAQNVAYGLQGKVSKAERLSRVEQLLALVGLPEEAHKYPAQLSGGQQQRIALARALALRPRLLLLDEPLSALDAQVRATLRGEITRLHRALGVTTILVTHDQIEALTMADRVVVMDRGEIVQVGTPREVYGSPAIPFVAQFVGQMNFLAALPEHPGTRVRCGSLLLEGPAEGDPMTEAQPPGLPGPLTVAIRPEDVRLALQGDGLAGRPNTLDARVTKLEFLGATVRVHLRPDAVEALTADLDAETARRLALVEGQTVTAQLPAERLRLFRR